VRASGLRSGREIAEELGTVLDGGDSGPVLRRDALLSRTVEAYKFFYPTVLNFEALEEYGAHVNRDS
jgi:hypothetical protein